MFKELPASKRRVLLFMAMLGVPLRGSFKVRCSGHAYNNAFLRSLEFLDGVLERGEE